MLDPNPVMSPFDDQAANDPQADGQRRPPWLPAR